MAVQIFSYCYKFSNNNMKLEFFWNLFNEWSAFYLLSNSLCILESLLRKIYCEIHIETLSCGLHEVGINIKFCHTISVQYTLHTISVILEIMFEVKKRSVFKQLKTNT